MMNAKQPKRLRRYVHPLMDDKQWDAIKLRDDDIIIASAMKAGTTWLQTIVANLIFQADGLPGAVMDISPWIERYRDAQQMQSMIDLLESQSHRRFLKTHLPLDALNYNSRVKYVFIGRDPRDVFVSLFNHHQNYTDERVQLHHDIARNLGLRWPEMPSEIHAFFERWINEPYFEWETEGTPYWSVFYHCNSWWQFRELPNLKLVHYDVLLNSPRETIAEITAFLDITVDESFWPTLLNNVSFDFMKSNGEVVMGQAQESFKGGAQTFINRGQSGGWRDILTAQENARYQEVASNTLPPAARHWLECGELDQPVPRG